MKRTYQPSKTRRARRHGFLVRSRTPGGRALLRACRPAREGRWPGASSETRLSVQAQPTSDCAPGRRRRPRSPAHARGAPPRPTTASRVNTIQARKVPWHREWGLRPGAPPPPCFNHRWPASSRDATALPGQVVRGTGGGTIRGVMARYAPGRRCWRCAPGTPSGAPRAWAGERTPGHLPSRGTWQARTEEHPLWAASWSFTTPARFMRRGWRKAQWTTDMNPGGCGEWARSVVSAPRAPGAAPNRIVQPRVAITCPSRTAAPGCQAGLKTIGPLGNSITTVEPSRKRPISSPCFRCSSRSR